MIRWSLLAGIWSLTSVVLAGPITPPPRLGPAEPLSQDINNFVGSVRRDLPKGAPHPWSTIGLLISVKKQTSCTAFLIGPAVIAASAHCLFRKGDDDVTRGLYEFYPGYHNGYGPLKAIATHAHFKKYKETRHRGDDWAIYALNWEIGTEVGWLHLSNLTFPEIQELQKKVPLVMAGYSRDYKNGLIPHVQVCRIEEELPWLNSYGHSCSGTNGASGSPIFLYDKNTRKTQVVAIKSGEMKVENGNAKTVVPYSTKTANIATKSTEFYELATTILRKLNPHHDQQMR